MLAHSRRRHQRWQLKKRKRKIVRKAVQAQPKKIVKRQATGDALFDLGQATDETSAPLFPKEMYDVSTTGAEPLLNVPQLYRGIKEWLAKRKATQQAKAAQKAEMEAKVNAAAQALAMKIEEQKAAQSAKGETQSGEELRKNVIRMNKLRAAQLARQFAGMPSVSYNQPPVASPTMPNIPMPAMPQMTPEAAPAQQPAMPMPKPMPQPVQPAPVQVPAQPEHEEAAAETGEGEAMAEEGKAEAQEGGEESVAENELESVGARPAQQPEVSVAEAKLNAVGATSGENAADAELAAIGGTSSKESVADQELASVGMGTSTESVADAELKAAGVETAPKKRRKRMKKPEAQEEAAEKQEEKAEEASRAKSEEEFGTTVAGTVEETPAKATGELDVKIDNAKAFRDYIKGVTALLDEGNLHFTKEGLTVQDMDSSGISMVTALYPSKYWSKWDTGKEVDYGLNLDNLGKILTGIKNDESLKIQKEGEMLKFTFTGRGGSREAELHVIEVRKRDNKEPKVDFSIGADVVMNGKTLKDLMKRANMVSSYMAIRVDKDKITFSAKGDAGSFKEAYTLGDDVKKIRQDGTPTEAVYNLEHVENMASTANKDVDVTMHMKSDQPMMMEYSVDGADLRYWLAPYVGE